MFQTVLSRIGWFIALLMLQVLVFNHVHIFGYATPMPYLYFLLILPAETPRWLYVLSGFVLGLLIDLFSSTPGMAAGTLTLIGLLTPPVLRLFRPSDDDDEAFLPSARTMEWNRFVNYAFVLSLVTCTTFFILEAFTFFDWQVMLFNIVGSTLLTTLIVVAMELIRSR